MPFEITLLPFLYVHSSPQGGGRKRGKTNFIFFSVPIQDEGFWNLLSGRFHQALFLISAKKFSRYRGNGGVIHIEYANDVSDSDISIVSNVKKHHALYLFVASVFYRDSLDSLKLRKKARLTSREDHLLSADSVEYVFSSAPV